MATGNYIFLNFLLEDGIMMLVAVTKNCNRGGIPIGNFFENLLIYSKTFSAEAKP